MYKRQGGSSSDSGSSSGDSGDSGSGSEDAGSSDSGSEVAGAVSHSAKSWPRLAAANPSLRKTASVMRMTPQNLIEGERCV